MESRSSDVATKNHSEMMGSFSIFPQELILEILKWLEVEDIAKTVSLLSSEFYALSSEYFLDNLYGRSLRFNKWQRYTLDELKINKVKFDKKHQVRLFSMANRSTDEAFFHASRAIVLSLAFLYLASQLYIFFSKLTRSVKEPSGFLILGVLLSLAVFVLRCVYVASSVIIDSNQQNNRFQSSFIKPKHLSALREFLEQNPLLSDETLQKVILNPTTIAEMITYVEQDINKVEKLSFEFSQYLKKRTGTKYLRERDINELKKIDPVLPAYANRASSLWQAKHPKEKSLFEDGMNKDNLYQQIRKRG